MRDFAALLFGEHGGQLDRTTIWTAVSATVTLIAVAVAWRQLAGLRAISRVDFTFRFMDGFFTSETRTLFLLLLNSALTFEEIEISRAGRPPDRLPCLKINWDIVRQIPGVVTLTPGKTRYSGFEVDDLLLGHFESLALYVRKKLIDFDAAYHSFSYYLIETLDHLEIKRYLDHDGNKNTYENFLHLHKRFKRKWKRSLRSADKAK